MTTYTVTLNHSGHEMRTSSGLTMPAAVERAAELARVTPRTIRSRIRRGSHSHGMMQVGGREVGPESGVWIMEEEG